MEGNTSKAPKGECATCGKLVSKSNMAMHRKVCGKKKAPKTRKVINRESYKRHKDKILNKRFEQRVFNRFRRLEVAREQLVTMSNKPLDVEPIPVKKWKPAPSTSLLHGISKDPNLFAFCLNTLRERCRKLYKIGPAYVEWPKFYKAIMFTLHPEKISSAACDFGSSTQEIYDFKLETVTAFNQLKVQLEADTDDLTEEVADGLSDAAYEREMNRIRRAKRDKAEGEATFSHLQDQLRMYRKRVEKHLASVSLHAANFQAKQEKAQALRDEELAKLKKVIEEFESKGPCATYDEFKESENQRRSNVQPVQE
ncbi:hypothetical protein F444_02845 [Phytophthora nicotianae P1976]|uniref:Uncharacterized protein n=1 Tax=Phytophthora nicotianae P1976 TaxID=1317066 RepID=A0A081AW17_PHYNI|nr:hypothetical protein F444_02845 [Phytophthora nicotianae P1976]